MAKQPVTENQTGEGKQIRRRGAWHPLTDLRAEMDRVFDDFVTDFPQWPWGRRGGAVESVKNWPKFGAWAPSVDITETDKAFEITADMPGIDEKDIELSLSDGVLTLKGEKKEETEKKEKDFHQMERHFGSFRRSFRLPDGVDEDKLTADYKKGVLTITLPKTPAAQKAAKTIKIKSS